MSIQSYQSSNFDKKDDFAEVDDSNPRKEDFTSSAASIPALDPIAPKPVVAPQPTIAEVHASADSASDSDGVRLIHVIRSKTTNFGFSIKKKKHGKLQRNSSNNTNICYFNIKFIFKFYIFVFLKQRLAGQ